MNLVSFYRVGNDDVALFHARLDGVPSVGEFISYSFELPDHQKAELNPDVLEAKINASRLVNNWRVVEVYHHIRETSIYNPTQTVAVFIEPQHTDD